MLAPMPVSDQASLPSDVSSDSSATPGPETQDESGEEVTVKDGETKELTEEEKTEVAAIKNVTAKITSVSLTSIKATTSDGAELSLTIPQTGASFTEQTTQADGSNIQKEIGFLELPKNKDVEIQYNSKTNTVRLVIVK